jgi:hypothetical protein
LAAEKIKYLMQAIAEAQEAGAKVLIEAVEQQAETKTAAEKMKKKLLKPWPKRKKRESKHGWKRLKNWKSIINFAGNGMFFFPLGFYKPV